MTGHRWRFGDCELDEGRHELRVRGTRVDIEPKPLEVLQQLVRHAGEVVTKDELLDAVWPGLTVVDGSLATAISKLRKVLGSGDDDLIVTVPRVGYRLAVPVVSQPIAPLPSPALDLAAGRPVPGRSQWRLLRRLDVSLSSDVWLAEHSKTHDTRVFKFAADAERLRGLKREVTVARLLRQELGERPDFPRLLEWNFESAPYFLESEHCGLNLAEWAEAQGGLGSIPLDTRLRLLVDVARAVAAAHRVGVLHKDLKPGNILIADADGQPQIVVADFGAAALVTPERLDVLGITKLGFTQTSENGALTGTVMYLAPELLSGQSPTTASDVYALGVLLFQMVVGDFRRPLAPGWEADIGDPLLIDDIAQAACGDATRRLHMAEALAERLSALDRRRAEAQASARAEEHADAAQRRRAMTHARRPWLVTAAVVAIAAVVLTATLARRSPPPPPRVNTLAVLPFQNVGTDTDLDFLRYALADEVTATLSRTRGLAVRPFATTSRFVETPADLGKLAEELSVDGIVAGRFSRANGLLHIAIDAFSPEGNRTVWHDTIETPADTLLAAQLQIGLRVRAGLAPAFGGTAVDAGPQPTHEEAYGLYLRSVSLPLEAPQNKDGLAMLEKAVALDPVYAPAWVALGRRYYVEARYGHGTPALMERYEMAMERATSLDPTYAAAVAGLVVSRVERGDLVGAYARAADLVRRRPDNADGHFALSYVLRFAGLLDDAAERCETALLLDPKSTTSGLRSCAIVFFLRGDFPRAKVYQRLYLGSAWAKAFGLDILVREGRLDEARGLGAPAIPQYPSYDLLASCASRGASANTDPTLQTATPSDDPEANYLAAAHLAYCRQPEHAVALLRRAIAGNYCSTAAFTTDRLFDQLRASPAMSALRASATDCQAAFVSQRGSVR